MAEQVEMAGESLKLLKQIEANTRGASSTVQQGARTRVAGGTGRDPQNVMQATTASMNKLGTATDNLTNRFTKLDRSVKMATSSFGKMIGRIGKGGAQGVKASPLGPPRPIPATRSTKAGGDSFESAAGSVSKLDDGITAAIPKIHTFGKSFGKFIELLKGPGIDILDDYFRLMARGITASENIVDFYKNAAVAGMSLQQYTQVLDANRAAVVRSTSFEDFNEKLEFGADSLGKMGIFGRTARELSGAMMTSVTELGIPQSRLRGTMQAQIDIFNHLRKTTGLTAQGFSDLLREVSSNENVQNELLGMAPAQRQARMLELVQIRGLGETMGLTRDASRQLGEALLAQRALTAVDRFKAMGTIRQAGAITGMGAQDTEELARLSGKKNRTGAENARFVQLGSQLKSGIESMQNSGSFGMEYIADQIEQIIPAGTMAQLKAAGVAGLQTDSGKPYELFQGSVSKFEESVGKFVTFAEGIVKNPLYGAVADAIKLLGSGLLALAAGKFLLGSAAGIGAAGAAGLGAAGLGAAGAAGLGAAGLGAAGLGAAGAAGAAGLGAAGLGAAGAAGAGMAGWTTSLGATNWSGPKTFVERLKGFGVALQSTTLSIVNSIRGVSIKTVEAGKTLATGGLNLATNMGRMAGSFLMRLGGPIAAIFSGIEEIFTGNMAAALDLGDGIFGRLLGIVVAGFNGILTGITRLVDDGINWVLEGLGVSTRVNFTKVIDYITSLVVVGFKKLIMTAAIALKETLSFFRGDDIPFVKSLNKTIISLGDSIEQQEKNTAEMLDTEGSTLRKQGEQVQKRNEIAAKATETDKKITAATSNVVNGIDSLASSALQTANEMRAGVQVAQPGQQARANVTQPEVNKPQVDSNGQVSQETQVTSSIGDMREVVMILQQQLDVAKQMLVSMTSQPNPVIFPLRSTLPDNAAASTAFYAQGFRQ